MAKKYSYQYKIDEKHIGKYNIYLITNAKKYYVGMTRNLYKRLAKHNVDKSSSAYSILKDGGCMYLLASCELEYSTDQLEKVLISLVRLLTGDYSKGQFKSNMTNKADYYTAFILRRKLIQICNQSSIFNLSYLNHELLINMYTNRYDEDKWEELCYAILHNLEEGMMKITDESIGDWALLLLMSKIDKCNYVAGHEEWKREQEQMNYYWD